jgi:KDO2-lipid IV(A) lauroyltransferase
MSHLGILFMRFMAHLAAARDPRPSAGCSAGCCTSVVVPRRRVVRTSTSSCASRNGARQQRRRARARASFIHVAQSWLDRGWLWHGDPAGGARGGCVITGATRELARQVSPPSCSRRTSSGSTPAVTALTQQVPRRFTGIYTEPEPTRSSMRGCCKGRHRFGGARPFSPFGRRAPSCRRCAPASVMYLLPDMNFGPEESIFVPFYGVAAATVPSLSRFRETGPREGRPGDHAHDAGFGL